MVRRSWSCLLAVLGLAAAAAAQEPRRVIPLDGTWEIAEGRMDPVPERFDRKVPVPGLVDMAEPAFWKVGLKNRFREAFWYRRTFRVEGPIPEFAILKVHKGTFGTRAILNGVLLGDHLPCFTPAYYDARAALREGDNELVIRVGAWRDALPRTVPCGTDAEKKRFLPGLFDSVELILCRTPHILRVQAAPDVGKKSVDVHVWLRHAGAPAAAQVRLLVWEASTGKVAGGAVCDVAAGADKGLVTIPLEGCRLWSPEDPFLYELEVRGGGDVLRTRFGMRSFRFDPSTGRAVLNGKTCFLRGTSVALYRFFEDAERGDRPWREDWVRRLHKAFRGMNWNVLRYGLGFPPESWYRIADEEGLLIQDEFPIWNMNPKPGDFDAEELAREYAEWMQERWNHPCVVVWDAQSETRAEETGRAIQKVRALDFSNRPWDNGWGPAQDSGDSYEAHPCLFSDPYFKLSDLEQVSGIPGGNALPNKGGNAAVLGEYGGLWITRDGLPTALTRNAYRELLGEDATPARRRHLYARYTAALTEFWRCRRACAAVLHFCGLGCSRANGRTSDPWADVENLKWEPEFESYMRDAFNPVGLMIECWAEDLPPGRREVPVTVINDLSEPWKGEVRFRLLRDGTVFSEALRPVEAAPLGDAKPSFPCEIPAQAGRYEMEAALVRGGDRPVRSRRKFEVLTEEEQEARYGIAVGKPARASSHATVDGTAYPPENAFDNRKGTKWMSAFPDPQWIAVDLGRTERVSRVAVFWDTGYAKDYAIEVSPDGRAWKEVFRKRWGSGNTTVVRFDPVEARGVRLTCSKRAVEQGYSVREFRVFR